MKKVLLQLWVHSRLLHTHYPTSSPSPSPPTTPLYLPPPHSASTNNSSSLDFFPYILPVIQSSHSSFSPSPFL